MKGSKAPQPPDPMATVQAQAQANRVQVETPYGNQIFGKYVANDKPADMSDADWNARGFSDRYRFEVDPSHAVMQVQESPEVAQYRQRMTAVAQALGDRASSLIADMPKSALRFDNGFDGGDRVARPTSRMGGAAIDPPALGMPRGVDMGPRTGGDPWIGLPGEGDPNPSRMPGNAGWGGLPGFTGAMDLSGAPRADKGLDGQTRSSIDRYGLDTAGNIHSDVEGMIRARPDAVTRVDRTGLPNIMAGVDTSGMGDYVRGVGTDALPDLSGRVDRSGLGDYERISFAGLPMLPGTDDYSADRDKVSASVFQRAKSMLDPDIAQERRRLEQRLADQGIPVGSEAYNSAVGNFERGVGDRLDRLAMDATVAGGAEQSRIGGEARATRGQLFGERQTDVGVANQARAARFGENLSDANLGNTARGQGFSEGVTNAQLANEVRRALFGEGVTQVGLNNQARSQGFQENLTDAQLQNDARSRALADALAVGGFRTGAQAQDYAQRMSDVDLANRAREQQLGENMGLRQAYISELSGNADRQNAARVQGINEQMTQRQNQFNELAALLGGPQVQGPPMMAPTPIDVAGPMALQYQGNLANWQASQARQNALLGAGAGLAGSWLMRR